MAKKSAKKPGPKSKPVPEKVRLEMRFDPDVYEKLRKLCDEASISVNQLLNGLARWASERGIVGEVDRTEEGMVRARSVPGCVFFGRLGWWRDARDMAMAEAEWVEGESLPLPYERGEYVFGLDFTERHVIREDLEPPRSGPKEEKD